MVFAPSPLLSVLLVVVVVNVSGESTDCSLPKQGGGVCIPIKECTPVVNDLLRARDAGKNGQKDKMAEIIKKVKDKVCGNREDRLICCTQTEEYPATPASAADVLDAEKEIGSFVNYFHGIHGTAYAVGNHTIVIKNFKYDGEGPDAFFWAGTTSKPNSRGKKQLNAVLPHPFVGEHYDYSDRNIPILGEFRGDEDISLSLPDYITVHDIKWLSVWCRDYKVNFGHVAFPDNL